MRAMPDRGTRKRRSSSALRSSNTYGPSDAAVHFAAALARFLVHREIAAIAAQRNPASEPGSSDDSPSDDP